MQVIDDGNIAGAVPAGSEDAPGLPRIEDRLSRAELLGDRHPAPDAAAGFALAGLGHMRERTVVRQTSAAAFAPRRRCSGRPEPCHCG